MVVGVPFRHCQVGSIPTLSTKTMNKKYTYVTLSLVVVLAFSATGLKIAHATSIGFGIPNVQGTAGNYCDNGMYSTYDNNAYANGAPCIVTSTFENDQVINFNAGSGHGTAYVFFGSATATTANTNWSGNGVNENNGTYRWNSGFGFATGIANGYYSIVFLGDENASGADADCGTGKTIADCTAHAFVDGHGFWETVQVTGAATPKQISIAAPRNGDTLINDPVMWELNATGTGTYRVQVQYATSTMAGINPTAVDPTFTLSDFGAVYTQGTMPQFIPESKSLLTRMAPASTSQIWYVRAFLFDYANGAEEGAIPIASSTEISFTMHQTVFSRAILDQQTTNQNGTPIAGQNQSYTGILQPAMPTSGVGTSTFPCAATSTDFWTGTMNWLFCIQPFATDAMNGTAQGFKLLPIVNNVTALDAVVQNEVSPTGELLISPSGTPSLMQQYDHLDFCPYVPDGATTSIICFRVLSSSSWTGLMDKPTHDALFQFEDALFALAPLALAIGLYLKFK